MTTKLDNFDHPCKETCSGWKQGFDKGSKAQAEIDKEIIEKLAEALHDLEMDNEVNSRNYNLANRALEQYEQWKKEQG